MTRAGAPRVAVLSSASGGGAGIAARRIVDALNASGSVDARFIDVPALGTTVSNSIAPSGSLSNRRISDTHFTGEFPGYARGWIVDLLDQYDLVNVHWASFLVSITELLSLALRGKPMLFTLHDYYYLTGGCHYPATCDQLATGCLSCPQVDTALCSHDVIAGNQALKREMLSLSNVHLSAPSAFLRDTAVGKGLIEGERAHVLRNAFSPSFDAGDARPFENRILLIADSLHEERKNMRAALEALARLHHGGATVFTVDVVGNAAAEMKAFMAATGVQAVFHGRITDQQALERVMKEADIVLTASLEDNWPNILVEAGSYGCLPVVGPGHGCEEFVKTFGYGVVAQDYRVDSLVTALTSALQKRSVSDRAVAAAAIRDAHAPGTFAKRYEEVVLSRMGLSAVREGVS